MKDDSMRARAKDITELMAQLANENRLLLLCALMEGPMTVGELAGEVPNITAPALSQHLHRLKEGGLVQAEKQGQYVRYSLKDPRLYALMRVLKQEYCTSEDP
ncbi:ArsR/SmtB family transcription factor [Intestinimonas massiliensis (ex Afouda et al. 2020)]|uniref:ArsR/SmtB family transcription factor n=1 Tax=Intestinimonas massiliensis (ex Afouda et al. 2020) TaxID=1673721 RepID=UPI001F5EFEDB|nr:metalloregulator ArsR/SmtB family transcription factor [Intestinimonas massiliensis (ex Afouda et al. 2020)]